jgi:tRNA G18 (ribose-2'-O)-methylase SpoU
VPRIDLESPDDPRIDVFRDLRGAQGDRRAGCFIAEGMWLVRRLLSCDLTTRAILADRQRVDEIGVVIPEHVPLYVLPDGQTEKVIGFNFHRGILACGQRPPQRMVADLPGLSGPEWLVVACEQVQDPENVGAILRNAAAFGALAVVLGPQCADPFSRRVLRVSMGAPFFLPVIQSPNLLEELAQWRAAWGAEIGVTVLDQEAQALESAVKPRRLVLVFGSEGHGLGPPWRSVADHRWTISMSPMADSLNVAACSAVFLHYFQR